MQSASAASMLRCELTRVGLTIAARPPDRMRLRAGESPQGCVAPLSRPRLRPTQRALPERSLSTRGVAPSLAGDGACTMAPLSS